MTARPLYEIAQEIEKDWTKVNFGARPYLDAMHSLTTINDHYLFDTGTSVVLYFLSNATSWRGETARRIKAELRDLMKKRV